jgi:undecaprenyl phosphate N,N'-diacetylbacillosamine 1-phosphate transferase
MYKGFFKRIFDIFLSIALILLLFPFMIFIFFIIWFKIGFPIFFQKRPGLNNKIFIIYKFKTLYDLSGSATEEERQNNLGIFLRKMGLDELPQLFNILQNKMSFVGPRPLLVEYLNKYSNYEKKRHLVKPGITGLAQVNPSASGKKAWKESIKLDIYYVSRVSFFLDMKILYNTARIIVLRKKQYKDFKKFYE